jgi:hypothetical protein
MVEILQKCLQMYSGVSILRARKQMKEESNDDGAAKLFNNLLEVDTDSWDAVIRNGIKAEDMTIQSLIAEIQKTMETVVLGLENGSMAQRVQAEYLRELVKRAESVAATTG